MTLPLFESYREIPLDKGLVAKVSPADFEWISQWKWHARKGKCGEFYALRISYPEKVTIRMHRLILDTPRYLQGDHINGDTLDNRRENLRVATHAQNMRNRGLQRNNSSGFKGVSWRKSRNKWVAKIYVDKKSFRVGSFHTKEEAYAAYCEAAKKYHGEFARMP